MSPSALVGGLETAVGHFVYGKRVVRPDAAQSLAVRNVLPGLNPARVCGRAPVSVSHADGLRLGFGDGSWLLVRPSRTTSAVRVCAEAPTPEGRDALLRAGQALCSPGRRGPDV